MRFAIIFSQFFEVLSKNIYYSRCCVKWNLSSIPYVARIGTISVVNLFIEASKMLSSFPTISGSNDIQVNLPSLRASVLRSLKGKSPIFLL